MTTASVCIATYNGASFVGEQLQSILEQLGDDDEVIIVDDGSHDDTVAIIEAFRDGRVRLFHNERNIGVNGTFARAIELATKDIIFLSDQDDIWTSGRKDLMLQAFEDPRVKVVAGNYRLIDRNGAPLPGTLEPDLRASESRAFFRNLRRIFTGRQNYYGCAMAFRATAKPMILPYPSRIECHDIWIGMIGITANAMAHLDEPVLLHRIHGNNASIVRRSLLKKLASRVILFRHLALAVSRTFSASRPTPLQSSRNR